MTPLERIATYSSVRRIVPVIEHWVNGDTRAPPFLKRTGRERYTLSDSWVLHASAQADAFVAHKP